MVEPEDAEDIGCSPPSSCSESSAGWVSRVRRGQNFEMIRRYVRQPCVPTSAGVLRFSEDDDK